MRELYHRLIASGFEPWLDEEQLLPGQNWRDEIPNAVRACDVVIVCLSRSSVTKEGYLQKEIRFALDVADEKPEGTIFIIPAKLEECDVPPRLSQWHWANLFEEAGYDRLVRALSQRASQIGHASSQPLHEGKKDDKGARPAWEKVAREVRQETDGERMAAQRAEAQRLAAEKAEGRIARDEAEAERAARERAHQERRKQEEAEAQRLAAERAEAERGTRDKTEQERAKREKAEKERLPREKAVPLIVLFICLLVGVAFWYFTSGHASNTQKQPPTEDAAMQHYNLADTQRFAGQRDGAIREYREAIRLKPDFANAHYELADMLSADDPDGAISEFKEVIRLRPRDVRAYLMLGDVLRVQKHDVDGAVSIYREAATLFPLDQGPKLQLAVALEQKGDLRGAREQYRLCESLGGQTYEAEQCLAGYQRLPAVSPQAARKAD